MFRLISLFIFCLIPTLHAMDQEAVESRSIEAESFYHLQQFEQAETIYRDLLAQKLSPQQRRIIMLNRVMAVMGRKQWPEAVALLKTLDLGVDPDPMLDYKRSALIVFGLYQQVSTALENIDIKDKESSLKALTESQKALEESLNLLEDVQRAKAVLTFLDGPDPQNFSIPLASLEDEVKPLFRQLTLLQAHYNSLHLSYQEKLTNLENHLQLLRKQLEDLSFEDLAKNIVKNYLNYYFRQEKANEHSWEEIRESLETTEEASEKELAKQKIFASAETQSMKGQELLREGRLWEARNAYSSALLYLSFSQWIESEVDPIEQLFFTRIPLVMEIEKKPDSKPYREFLKWDLEILEVMLIQGLKLEENELIAVSESDDSFKVEAGQQLRQLAFLQDQVNVPSESHKQAQFDLFFYHHLSQLEAIVLQKLYIDFLNQDARDLELYLFMLYKKFELRREDENADLDKIDRVRSYLKVATQNLDDQKRVFDELENALLVWDPKRPLDSQIEYLLKLYRKETEKAKLQMKGISSLNEKHEELEALFIRARVEMNDTNLMDLVESDLAKAQQSHGYAVRALEGLDSELTVVFLDDAKDWLRQAQEKLRGPLPQTPEELLVESIKSEKRALTVNQALMKTKDPELMLALTTISSDTQSRTLNTARFFPQLVLDHMNKEREPEEAIPDLDTLTQETPWDQVFPLFNSGFAAAELAENYIEARSYTLAMPEQQKAINDWEEALKKLKNPEKPPEGQQDDKEEEGEQDPDNNDDSGKDDGNKGDSDADEEENENEGEAGDSDDGQAPPPTDVFEALQQMQKDDESLQSPSKKPLREGLRPW
jgi:hypothetical protein